MKHVWLLSAATFIFRKQAKIFFISKITLRWSYNIIQDIILYNMIQYNTKYNMQHFRSWINFEIHLWQSPLFCKVPCKQSWIPLKVGLHHGCFSESFQELLNKLLFPIPLYHSPQQGLERWLSKMKTSWPRWFNRSCPSYHLKWKRKSVLIQIPSVA